MNLDCGVCCIIGNNGFIWVRDTMGMNRYKAISRNLSERERQELAEKPDNAYGLEEGDQNINNSSSVEIDRQKKEYSEKVIGPEVRRRISRVVKSIMDLK